MSVCVNHAYNKSCTRDIIIWKSIHGVLLCDSCLTMLTSGGYLKYIPNDMLYRWNFPREVVDTEKKEQNEDALDTEKKRLKDVKKKRIASERQRILADNGVEMDTVGFGYPKTKCNKDAIHYFRGPHFPTCLDPNMQNIIGMPKNTKGATARKNMSAEAYRIDTFINGREKNDISKYDSKLSTDAPDETTLTKIEKDLRQSNAVRNSIESWKLLLDNVVPMHSYSKGDDLKLYIATNVTPFINKISNICHPDQLSSMMFKHQLYLKYICQPYNIVCDEVRDKIICKPAIPRLLVRYNTGSGKTPCILSILSNFLTHPTLVLLPDDDLRTQFLTDMYGEGDGISAGVWPIRKLIQTIVDDNVKQKKFKWNGIFGRQKWDRKDIMQSLPMKKDRLTDLKSTIIPDISTFRCHSKVDTNHVGLFSYISNRVCHRHHVKYGPIILTFEEFNILLQMGNLEGLKKYFGQIISQAGSLDLSKCNVFVDEVHELTPYRDIIRVLKDSERIFTFSATILGKNASDGEKQMMQDLMMVKKVEDVWKRTLYYSGGLDIFKSRCYELKKQRGMDYLNLCSTKQYDKKWTKTMWEDGLGEDFDVTLQKEVDQKLTVRENIIKNMEALSPTMYTVHTKLNELLNDTRKTVAIVLKGPKLGILSKYLETQKIGHTRLFSYDQTGKIVDRMDGMYIAESKSHIGNDTMIKIKEKWNMDPKEFFKHGTRVALFDSRFESGHNMKHFTDVIIGDITNARKGTQQKFTQLLGRFDRSCEPNTTVKYHFIESVASKLIEDQITQYNTNITHETEIANKCLLDLGSMRKLVHDCKANTRKPTPYNTFKRYRIDGDFGNRILDKKTCAIFVIIIMASWSEVVETNVNTMDRIVDHVYNISPVGEPILEELLDEVKIDSGTNMMKTIENIVTKYGSKELQAHIKPQLNVNLITGTSYKDTYKSFDFIVTNTKSDKYLLKFKMPDGKVSIYGGSIIMVETYKESKYTDINKSILIYKRL